MRFLQLVSGAVAFTSYVSAQVDSKASCDSVTKICYQTYTHPTNGISIGVALPTTVQDPYDAIVKITAPVSVPWVGLAWGGTMVWNPLTVAWPNGNTAVGSSRFAFGQSLPPGYDGAELSLLKGTTTNATHWTMNAVCKGCTSWQANDGSEYVLNGTGTTQFAWARGGSAVATPSSNTSDFSVHQDFGKWTHDLNAARSSSFNSWVSSNALPKPSATSTSASSTSGVATSSPTTLKTTTTAASGPTGKATIPSTCSGAGAPVFSSVLASGWKATKVLGGLTSPRSLVWDSAGNLLMVQSGKGITVHKVGADGCITSSATLVALNSLNHGITFSADGKTLYASSMTTVYSWPYTASSQTVGTRSTVITGMFNGGAHTTRTLLIGAHAPNLLVVSHGSSENLDAPCINPATGRAIIKVFDLSKLPSSGYNYVSGGYVMGYGLRNDVGITFDGNNMLWGVENSADQFTRGGKDIHNNNPAEKLNYIGDISTPNNNWYGYPTCFQVWEASDFTGLQSGDPFVLSPNTTFSDATCKTKITEPSLIFMAHSAPIDSKFDGANANLYVSFHGSWNRSPTTGFKLVQVPFAKGTDGSYKPVAPVSSTTGYNDIMWNPDVTRCAGNGPSLSSGCFRPAGLVFDSSDRLYMTSDTTSNAELWILGKS